MSRSRNFTYISLIFTILATGLFSCIVSPSPLSAQNSPPKAKVNKLSQPDLPVMVFDKRHIDLGKVKKGENIRFSYRFTNRGKADLMIDFISGCDCTELDWPVKTFKPGESGTIDVVFLSGKKEASETVEIDILLKNLHPETGNPIMEILSYSYTF